MTIETCIFKDNNIIYVREKLLSRWYDRVELI